MQSHHFITAAYYSNAKKSNPVSSSQHEVAYLATKNCHQTPFHVLHAQRKSSIDRVIGASPFVGGLRGSSSKASESRCAGVWKKDDRGNSNIRGENTLGVGGTSAVDPKLREKLCRGLLVISVERGDNKPPQSLLSPFGRSLLMDISPKPKSKPPSRSIAELVIVGGSTLTSGLAIALSRAAAFGVELPLARDGVEGRSFASADRVGLCFTDGFRAALIFSVFFLSMTFLKSFNENKSDMFGLTQRDFDCASVYASFGPRSWLMYIPYAMMRVADRLAPC